MSLRSALLGGALLTGAMLAADVAAAQDTRSAQVEEVVVTARKREETLQSVPVAVTAATGEALQEQGVREVADLGRNVPSLRVTSNSPSSTTGAIFSLRGQSASDLLLTLSQPVGLYEDSVNIPHPVGSNIAFFDLARVEVLKGPQGTLYGRNTTGGAINLITRNADNSGLHGFVFGEVGNYEDWKVAGAINVPIIEDKLSARLAYQHWNREGFGRSAVTGQHLGSDKNDDIARLSVQFDPTNYLAATFKAEYIHADRTDGMYTMRALVSNPALAAFGIPAPFYVADAEARLEGVTTLPSTRINDDLFTNQAQLHTSEKLESWHLGADVSWDITDNVTLRSITGYHWFEEFRVADLDAIAIQGTEINLGQGGGAPFFNPAFGTFNLPFEPDQTSGQFSQELNLSGEAVDGRLSWLLGAFYADDNGDGTQSATNTPALSALPPPGGLGFPFGFQQSQQDVKNKTWAVFTQNDFKFNDVFSITLGARYTEEELSQRIATFLYNASNAPVANRFICTSGPFAGGAPRPTREDCRIEPSAQFSGTSYLASLNAQLTPTTLVYAKTARGFRGGALQGRAVSFPAARPEIAVDYEIGLKTDFADRRIRLNVAAYKTDYTNKQETAIIIINNVTSTPIQNAAEAEIKGLEAELNIVPTRDLTFYGSLTYLDAKYGSFPAAITPRGPVDASGLRFTTSPKITGYVGMKYEHEVGPGVASFNADWAYRGKIPTTLQNDDPAIPRGIQDSWRKARGILNLNLSYDMPDQQLTFSVFGTNVTDERYQVQGLAFNTLGYLGTTQEPRMWGVSVRKAFGEE